MRPSYDCKACFIVLFLLEGSTFQTISILPHAKADQVKSANLKDVLPVAPAPYDTKGKIPGNAANGIEDLKRIYQVIQIYRARHEGAYPANGIEVGKEVTRHSKEYGFKDYQEAWLTFTNPDTQYIDSQPSAKDAARMWIYQISDKRLDGSPVGGPKPMGTRDVLAWTNIYIHMNPYNKAGEDSTMNPVGFFLVLWDDGQVEKIAYDQVLFLPVGGGVYTNAFPGQAGVPTNCLTYDEFHSKIAGFKSVPRGKPVAEGHAQPAPDNGGPESLISLSLLFQTPIESERLWKTFDVTKETFSLPDLQTGAAKLGLTLQEAHLTLQQIQQHGLPALLHLREPDRIVTLATNGLRYSIVYDGGMVRIVDNATLTRRYTGDALLTASNEAQAQITFDNPVQVIESQAIDQSVIFSVTLTNRGEKPLMPEVEQPACGCAQVELSPKTLAPGQSGTFNVTIKPRAPSEGQFQSFLIFIRTSDALCPRALLGFQIRLPKSGI